MTILDRSCLALNGSTSPRDEILSESGALLLVDKTYGDTSFSAVNRIRKQISIATGIRKIKCGHAGTLDPLASGLLILATRGKTKSLADLIGLDKIYSIGIRFGVTSASFDLERPIEITGGDENLTEEAVRTAIEALVGEHDQVPPMHSAIKQRGRPVYHRARAGEQFELQPRRIFVHNSSVVTVDLPLASFRTHVSKGTYIRSLARDLGVTLGTGAVVTDLRREAISGWKVEDAMTVDEIESLIRN
ncbi:MAG: tRNA pseudouridine(55) synthase TruB [Bacteroidota bacterium]|nr:tRNA pseudouridine(55) synthase TruB [Bacteroidota bacterium]MDP4232712.1 tRNA pseudouridine(55) synthase TruB [Bacteroidota bacterium]MDP4243155.1 tRNA pseudouridine(55) synthase TruB [Bacteroidota bacterium]MDP4287612.1 tRNA pseudouridine(55) synthase TruB [Bacteroidota bacterium]